MEPSELDTYERSLSEVFATGNQVVATRMARLAVLYEDLRIEYLAAGFMKALEPLDDNGEDYRRLYFIRRIARHHD